MARQSRRPAPKSPSSARRGAGQAEPVAAARESLPPPSACTRSHGPCASAVSTPRPATRSRSWRSRSSRPPRCATRHGRAHKLGEVLQLSRAPHRCDARQLRGTLAGASEGETAQPTVSVRHRRAMGTTRFEPGAAAPAAPSRSSPRRSSLLIARAGTVAKDGPAPLRSEPEPLVYRPRRGGPISA